MKLFLVFSFALLLSACSHKVIVKKDSCKDIYGGTLMECDQVTK